MITAIEFVRHLGLGWNLGNTFDAFPLEGEREAATAAGRDWTPEDQQRLWRNKPFTAECAANVKAAGFDTIRIPVTWMEWADADGIVQERWMAAVQQAVDWSLDAGLNVILNVHHDGGNGDTLWIRRASRQWDAVSRRYEGLWRSIATRFADYDHRLVLEGGNEICFPDVSQDQAFTLLNRLNQIFVDVVRATGGRNADRYLLIPGFNTDTVLTCDERYRLPQDSIEDRLIVSIHYYSPAEFALAEHDCTWGTPATTWGTAAEVEAVAADFALQRARFIDHGIPVIIGEYGLLTEPVDGKDRASNIAWLKTVVNCALDNESCPVLWDTSVKEMCFLDRETGRFYDPDVAEVFAAARARLDGEN